MQTQRGHYGSVTQAGPQRSSDRPGLFSKVFDGWLDSLAPCPWPAHVGSHLANKHGKEPVKQALYTREERIRRDASPWTLVQAILAPLQFVVFAISLVLVVRYLMTGEGYDIATASILAKTFLLYLIMVTGSIWEKEVFGKWLFARAFFWEDVFSMLVLGLQTAYLLALLNGWGSPSDQMMIAVAAYAAYVINAAQFLLKLREARLQAPRSAPAMMDLRGHST
ncbi:MAG: 2-vinyl bacteriochlorophyllide hydratase [Hyphomonadaceae bacterium]|jgi:3-vinyl bacteriochlorophyllide hydratase|nr:2-vinyl bacteriochlorophyllide hydratase [Hyphomonadaceae bacterium]